MNSPRLSASILQLSKLWRSLLLASVFTSVALLLVACSRNSELVGKWQGTEPADIMEFRADGTFTTSGKEPLRGKFTFNGSSLTLKMDGPLGKALGNVSVDASLEGDTLKMKDRGQTEVYKRMK